MRRAAALATVLTWAWAPALAHAEPATPELIDRAQERGAINAERADVLRVQALRGSPLLPAAYRSRTPWRGTLTARKIRRDRPAVRRALRAVPDIGATCDTSVGGTAFVETDHFFIQFTPGTLGDLDASEYGVSLEEAWDAQIGTFGWKAPPLDPDPDLEGKYHVILDPAIGAGGVYGFVSPEGTYTDGPTDNPHTDWVEGDAEATCMVLASDYAGFPGTPQQALNATTAHEFNHTLQYGLGALDEDLEPGDDDHVVEGGATWMEDEVQDAADDNYNYLYPDFTDSLGSHDEGDTYAYWLTFRGLTERFGTGTADGGQRVMREFWERVSEFGGGGMLDHLDDALATVSPFSSLADAYHDYAIAARLVRSCGGGFALPFCFEEADGYVATAGVTDAQRVISAIPGSVTGAIEDNYALNWVDLPTGAVYHVSLANLSSGGQLRGTVICDNGFGVTSRPISDVIPGGIGVKIFDVDARSCDVASLVITNQTQASGNPSSSVARSYRAAVELDEPLGNPPPTGSGGPASSAPAADSKRPILTLLSLSRRRFRAFGSGPGISARRGTRVRYRLSEKATVRVGLQRRNRRGRWVALGGTAIDRGVKGTNSFRFSGRWRRKRLPPGLYRLRLVPTDGSKNVGVRRTTRTLRIVRR